MVHTVGTAKTKPHIPALGSPAILEALSWASRVWRRTWGASEVARPVFCIQTGGHFSRKRVWSNQRNVKGCVTPEEVKHLSISFFELLFPCP